MQRNHKNKDSAITTSSDFEEEVKEAFLPGIQLSAL